MSKTKMKLNILLAFIVSALILLLFAGGCASQQKDSSSTEGGTAQSSQEAVQSTQVDGAFVSDEQCMSCHGESYEAVAELTADLGDWNPHDSIHGGYNTCVNCHEADQVLSYNYCSQCHAYAPDEESLFL